MHVSYLGIAVAVCISACCTLNSHAQAAEPTRPAPDASDLSAAVKSLLSDRCFICHGPDETTREADLRLDTPEGVLAESQGGEAEHVVKPGNPLASELWLRINSDDQDLVMPPADSQLKLTAAERDLIRRWIQQGAEWQAHWSFQPLRWPADESTDAQQNVDTFVRRRLAEVGRDLAPRAAPHRLLRRVTMDLTGLPPTATQLAKFTANPTDKAYADLVDRLLTSPAFGERVASTWLDAARYSDTYGYQVDRDRFVWPYRDWVIRAFNRNLPYDQFLTEQLAGDLLPNATQDQILATTFNRLHPQKVEGGSTPEEFRIEYVADRTQTFATAVLGLTLECARCHDHKYDPLSQAEYYQLTAFFDQIDEAGLYSYFTPSVPTPTLLLQDNAATEQLRQLQAKVDQAQRHLDDATTQANTEFDVWLQADKPPAMPAPIEHVTFDNDKLGANRRVAGVVGQAVELTGDDAFNLKKGNFRREQPFSISLWLRQPTHRERAVVFHRSRAWTDAGSRGYQLLLEDGRLSASLIHFWPGNAIRVRAQQAFPLNQWHQVTITYDGSSKASGLRIFLDGQPLPTTVVRDNLYKKITGGGNDHISIGQRFRDQGLAGGQVDEFRVFDRQLSAPEVTELFKPGHLQQLWQQRSDSQQHATLRQWFLADHPQLAAARGQLQKAVQTLHERREKLPEIMVMRQIDAPRQTYVLRRGAYDQRAAAVRADTPAVLPPFPADQPRNRLTLARWLTSPKNPLTARVAVNRFWQLLFGQGLVRTPEDFGSQGQAPTHPQLLDWLARDFIRHDWNVKRLIKQIVLSRTYTQSSQCGPELIEADPENTLYGRAPSYRWPAELLRDQALASSQLLVDKLGGEPAKPYELAVSFKPVKPDTGDGLYRRSIYTYWKRTGPAPAMMALDAAKRDVCRVKRGRTSSPLQTLVLMNGPQFVEAARGVAVRCLEHFGKSQPTSAKPEVADQIQWLATTMLARQLNQTELDILLGLYDSSHRRYAADAAATKKYLAVGNSRIPASLDAVDAAALTTIANTLMGLDEWMMKY